MEPKELFKWRKKQGYTRKALSNALGVTITTIYRWEKAMREIPPFLHLALKYLEGKGGKPRQRRRQKKKEFL
jgi:transcriptional regulator with XRE-family HTH domain